MNADCNSLKLVRNGWPMLKEKGACWSCLKIEHCRCDWKRNKICGENGCITNWYTEKQHQSTSLHQLVPTVAHYAIHACSKCRELKRRKDGPMSCGTTEHHCPSLPTAKLQMRTCEVTRWSCQLLQLVVGSIYHTFCFALGVFYAHLPSYIPSDGSI